MSTDPWCKKCPMFLECLEAGYAPRTICCDVMRSVCGHLSDEDIDRLYPDPMERMILVIDCF